MYLVERVAFIVALSIGVAFSATAYAVVYVALVQELPYVKPQQLVSIADKGTVSHLGQMDKRAVLALAEQQGAFTGVGAYHLLSASVSSTNDGAELGHSAILTGASVTPSMFTVLGVHPEAGRTFNAGDGGVRSPFPMIISAKLAKRGLVPGGLGSLVYLDGTAYEVVGILSERSWFPDRRTMFWIPFVTASVPDATWRANVVARLADGVNAAHARTSATALLQGIGITEAELELRSYSDELRAPMFGPLLLTQAAACLVLLLGIVSGAWTLLASARRGERNYAMHSALGASRWRLIWVFLRPVSRMIVLVAVSAAFIGWGLLHVLLPAAPYPLLSDAGVFELRLGVIVVSATAGIAACLTVIPALVLVWRASSRRELLLGASPSRPSTRIITAAMAVQVGIVIALAAHALWMSLLLGEFVSKNVGLPKQIFIGHD